MKPQHLFSYSVAVSFKGKTADYTDKKREDYREFNKFQFHFMYISFSFVNLTFGIKRKKYTYPPIIFSESIDKPIL